MAIKHIGANLGVRNPNACSVGESAEPDRDSRA